ncbi:unnamed protein product, partial [Trichogramma brassicae]
MVVPQSQPFPLIEDLVIKTRNFTLNVLFFSYTFGAVAGPIFLTHVMPGNQTYKKCLPLHDTSNRTNKHYNIDVYIFMNYECSKQRIYTYARGRTLHHRDILVHSSPKSCIYEALRREDNCSYIQTTEFTVSGIPSSLPESENDRVVGTVLTCIGAQRFLSDITRVRRLKPKDASSEFRTLLVVCKSSVVRDEIVRLKILKGDIPVADILPTYRSVAQRKLYLNEWLPQATFTLLQEVKAKALAKLLARTSTCPS